MADLYKQTLYNLYTLDSYGSFSEDASGQQYNIDDALAPETNDTLLSDQIIAANIYTYDDGHSEVHYEKEYYFLGQSNGAPVVSDQPPPPGPTITAMTADDVTNQYFADGTSYTSVAPGIALTYNEYDWSDLGLDNLVSETSDHNGRGNGQTLPIGSPTDQDFLSIADWVYGDGQSFGPIDVDVQPFDVSTNHFASSNTNDAYKPRDAFYGAAFVQGSGADANIIVGFKGTYDKIGGAWDGLLAAGGSIPALQDGLNFVYDVEQQADEDGISLSHIYLAGHSLGGAIAEYVASYLGLGGVTYGAPGISTSLYGPESGDLVNYVEGGDPIGNFSTSPRPSPDGAFVPSRIQRLGSPTYIGTGRSELSSFSNYLLHPVAGDFDISSIAPNLSHLIHSYHSLGVYARDLGLNIANPISSSTDAQAYLPAFNHTT